MSTTTATSSGLHALLQNIVDYAGFFPPADLSLEEAMNNYARYRRSPDAWMLGRFVCKTNQLDDLGAHTDLFGDAPPFRFSVLAEGGDTPSSFLDSLKQDLRLIQEFHARHNGRARIEAVEASLPPALLKDSVKTLMRFLDKVHTRSEAAGLEDRPTFFLEIPINDDLRTAASKAARALSEHETTAFALKMRCGGPTPADHPPPEHAAAFIMACLGADVPFKATAGLHHPFRHYHESAQTHMHGFINLFGGTALAQACDLDAPRLQSILEDEVPNHFALDDDGLHWKNCSASPEALREVRATRALSFGSCSFDDPRKDLRTHGLLRDAA